jgi:hypothetical protein
VIDGLRTIAGAQPRLLAEVPTEGPRYTALGALLIGAAGIALLSMWVALAQVVDAGWLLGILLAVPAAIWAGFILLVDRALIVGVSTTARWRRTSTLVVRLIVSGVLGFVVAEPLVLAVFHTAIETHIRDSRDRATDDLRTNLLACHPIPGDPPPPGAPTDCAGLKLTGGSPAVADAARLAALQKQAEAQQKAVEDHTTRKNDLDETARRECAGEPGVGYSGVPGEGPLCLRARAVAAEFAAAHDIARENRDLMSLREQIQGLQGPTATSREGFQRERDGLITARVAQFVSNQPAIGLLERMDALEQLTGAHDGLWLREWFLRGFLVVLDCLPVLVKFLGGVTAYDRMAEKATVRSREVHAARTLSSQRQMIEQIRLDEEKSQAERDAERRRHAADLMEDENREISEREARLAQLFGDPGSSLNGSSSPPSRV